MSPYPVQVTHELIVETAWELVEAEGGIDNLPLSRLAKQLGIKAPSLYRHVESKEALVDSINEYTESLIFDAMTDILNTTTAPDTTAQLVAIACEFRTYGHRYPVTYALRFSTTSSAIRHQSTSNFDNLLQLQGLLAQLSGEEESLTALRGYLALMHGFVMLEINGQLQRGGNLDEAFEKSVRAYLRGWQNST